MGKQKIVISERDNLAALFEDDQVCEFIIHRGDVLLGDVYLAQVENILPSIDAAFVNVGTERMGFLHSSDVQGRGDLKNRLQPKQRLIVQVIKEPTGHKGPRVTTNLAMPGRFLVFLPDSKGISISRKILNPKERTRLKSIVSLTKPPGVGVIIRTEAEAQSDAEIQDDFETLMERWQNIVALADTGNPPALLHRDQDLLYRVIRELVSEETTDLIVDSQFGQHRAQQLLQNWGIQHNIKVSLHEGNQNILVGTGVEKEIRNALQTRVPLPSGGYIYVQTTEALTVVDVNSGKFTSLESQEATILHTNLEAAKEIARQLRLRNIGGMIVVDFIDMTSRANQLTVLQAFEEMMEKDKGKPQIGQLSDLGLVEMTRHRQGQSLSEIFTKKCLSCNGAAHVVEDFNWAPPSSAGDYNRFGNQRFPTRQQDRRGNQRGGRGGGQGQQGQQGQGQNGQQQGGRGQNAQQTLQKYLSPQAGGRNPLREGFLQNPSQAQTMDEATLTKTGKLDDVFVFWLLKKFGLTLANTVKIGQAPIEVNVIVARMNPKANDVFTLVQAIESSGGMASVQDEEDDDDALGDEAGDETQNGIENDDLAVTDAPEGIIAPEEAPIGDITEEVEEVIEVMQDGDDDALMPHQFYDADDSLDAPGGDDEPALVHAHYEHAVAVLDADEDGYDTLDPEDSDGDAGPVDMLAGPDGPKAPSSGPGGSQNRRRGRPPAKRSRKPNA